MSGAHRYFHALLNLRPRSVVTFARLVATGRFGDVRNSFERRLNDTVAQDYAWSVNSLSDREGLPSHVKQNLDEVERNPSSCYRTLLALREKYSARDVKLFVDHLDFKSFDYLKPRAYHDFSSSERECYIHVGDMIAQTPAAAVSLIRAVEYVASANIPGAFVECGVFKGGSGVLMAKTLLQCGIRERDIYFYDTFEGMPKPSEHDVAYTGYRALDHWRPEVAEADKAGSVACSEEEVRKNVRRAGYPDDRFHFVPGLVEDTIPRVMPDRIALLRLDTDYYESTKHEMEHLFPRLERGGILIIDDYGAFLGARKAVDEYLTTHRIPLYLARVDEHVRIAVKLG